MGLALVAISADVPDRIQIHSVKIANLPKGWRRYPAPEALQDIGMQWAKKGSTLVLAVPSAVIPEEHNDLLNPAHRDFKRVRLHRPMSFRVSIRVCGNETEDRGLEPSLIYLSPLDRSRRATAPLLNGTGK